MSLVTPDSGLLFWMLIIFGILFFILAKFGFPMITGSVDERASHIEDSLKAAEEAQKKLADLAKEQSRMIEETKLEQGRILKEATEARDRIIAQAKEQAADEASKIVEHARIEIAAERESAVRDIRNQVAALSVDVAEKIVRTSLKDSEGQTALIDRMVDEASRAKMN